MNPQDLLYTNEFLTTSTVSKKEFDENNKNYVRYKNFSFSLNLHKRLKSLEL